MRSEWYVVRRVERRDAEGNTKIHHVAINLDDFLNLAPTQTWLDPALKGGGETADQAIEVLRERFSCAGKDDSD